jgi:hypothetical protein
MQLIAGELRFGGGSATAAAVEVRYDGAPPPILGSTTQPLDLFTADLPV